jgi:hypothetical protein
MSAAPILAPAPLAEQGQAYWEDLIRECQRSTHGINAVAAERGLPAEDRVECRPGPELHIFKPRCPSTSVKLRINYCSWGPMIDGIITGQEDEDREFCPEEFTVPIAKDLDGSVVAIYEEGRSFSPRDLACYVMQSFRRCFPGLSLPCDQPA